MSNHYKTTKSQSPHYDKPNVSLMRFTQTVINHFTDKYDKPNTFYHQNQPNPHQSQCILQNGQTTTSHSKKSANKQTINHAPIRSSKSLGCLTSVTTTPNIATSTSVNTQSYESNVLPDYEVAQIEALLRSHKSHVYVGRCLVNLYFTKTDLTNGGRVSKPRIHEWELSRTGIPVIIFDKGDTKARDKRQLQIFLSERGSGFCLWRDIIDNLSDYSAHHPSFHTLYLSSDHRKMAGLSFDSQLAAHEFYEQIAILTSDPHNISLTGPNKTNNKKKFLKKQKSLGMEGSGNNGSVGHLGNACSYKSNSTTHLKLPKKSDISSPCLFQHIASVEICDYERLYSLSTLVPFHQSSQQPPQLSSSISTRANTIPSSISPTSTSPSTISDSNVSV